MNITQAEATASLYEELIRAIDVTRVTPPKRSYSSHSFEHKNASSVRLEDGQIVIKWSAYAGCGDYDEDETHHRLEEFFD